MTEFLRKLNKTDIRNIIAVLFCTGVIFFIYVLAYRAVPAANKDLVNVIGGSVMTGVSTILSYYFGASKTNEKKEEE